LFPFGPVTRPAGQRARALGAPRRGGLGEARRAPRDRRAQHGRARRPARVEPALPRGTAAVPEDVRVGRHAVPRDRSGSRRGEEGGGGAVGRGGELVPWWIDVGAGSLFLKRL